ncbi:MAG: MCE family protein [Planctomycetes bacterium]|nr:MCE family protein [Planctomycetota bacterium]
MDERVVQFRVGVMVLASLIIAAILVLLFGEMPRLVRDTYTVFMSFPSAPGVTVDTPVRKSGILIGRVTRVELVEQGGVVVTAAINTTPRANLRQNEVPRIKGGLLGDSVIEFVPSGIEGAATTPVEDGALLPGIVVADPLSVIADLQGQLDTAVVSFSTTSNEIGRLAQRAGNLMEANEAQVSRIVAKTESTIDAFKQVGDNANNLLGDPQTQESVRKSINNIPELLKDIQQTTEAFRQTMSGMQQTMQRVDRNLANLEGFTGPLGERGEEFVNRIDVAMRKLDVLLDDLSGFTRGLSGSQGTLGQLVNDPELYNNLNSAIRNVNQLTKDLKPILNDARVFTDKIARDPGTLGVRGALDRNNSRTKYAVEPAYHP